MGIHQEKIQDIQDFRDLYMALCKGMYWIQTEIQEVGRQCKRSISYRRSNQTPL